MIIFAAVRGLMDDFESTPATDKDTVRRYTLILLYLFN